MHTDAKHYYAVLGVDPVASEEAIRGAFRRRAKELHPDAESGNASAFILVKLAYDTLMNPERRAAYDRDCQPARQPAPQPHRPSGEPRRRQPYRDIPLAPQPRRSKSGRRGGVGFVRYAIAFCIMALISLGGVQAMIILTEAPPSIQTRNAGHTETIVDSSPAAAAEPSSAPGSSKSGFWEASPAPIGKKTP
jgi:curved DNA-binding protein CbpA